MRRFLFAPLTMVVVFITTLFAQSSTETVLHSFAGGTDGADPVADLVYDSTTGFVYGTTNTGGTVTAACPRGCGTVFAMSSAGSSYSVVYRFLGGADGANPQAGLLLDSAGNLYGTTYNGGTHNLGTIFRLSPLPAGGFSETVLHSFAGADGSHPLARLVTNAAGNLFGTTYTGGAHGHGTVFELQPVVGAGWIESVLFSFTGANGANPRAGVVLDAAGDLWGTTYKGGTVNLGTVFKLSLIGSTWQEVFLFPFSGPDGANPRASVTLDSAGDVFGTTQFGGTPTCAFAAAGCGVVFELQPSGGSYTEVLPYIFQGGVDGAAPLDALTLALDSAGAPYLYGTASQAGIIHGTCPALGCGTAFELCGIGSSCAGSAPWTPYTLFDFTGTLTGRTPAAGMLVFPPIGASPDRIQPPPKGRGGCTAACLGTTSGGGKSASGTIYQLTN